jgi:hypothetical protein
VGREKECRPGRLLAAAQVWVATYLRAATDDVADSKGPLNYLKKSLKIAGAMSLQKARSCQLPHLPWIKPMKISFKKKIEKSELSLLDTV